MELETDLIMNLRTAEVFDAIKINTDFENFDKVWFSSLLGIFEKTTPELKLLLWLVANRDDISNQVICNQRVMAKKSNISISVINRTLNNFIKVGFLKKIQNGVYMINPLIVVKGKSCKQKYLALEFNSKK